MENYLILILQSSRTHINEFQIKAGWKGTFKSYIKKGFFAMKNGFVFFWVGGGAQLI